MLGAFVGATVYNKTGVFLLAIVGAVLATMIVGAVAERLVLRRLYRSDHLHQVLATFGFILVFDELAKTVWGPAPYYMSVPPMLSGSFDLAGVPFPTYRLMIVAVGISFAACLYVVIHRSRLGMLIRASSHDPEIVAAMGVNVKVLNALVFTIGCGLAGLAGILAAPIVSIEPGMGSGVLILTLVVIVVGGVGSIKGAFLGAILIGCIDTCGRVFIGPSLANVATKQISGAAGPALASIIVYVVMAVVLAWRPQGLFSVR